jgi:hypothetical protein
MKPRLVRIRGWWRCGLPIQTFLYWSQAETPAEAYELWKRGGGR